MKKILFLLLIFFLHLNADDVKIVVERDGPAYIIKLEKGTMYPGELRNHYIYALYQKGVHWNKSEEIEWYLLFKKAHEVTKEAGKKYFVIVNPEINNLKGFPINNKKDLQRYCSGKDECQSIFKHFGWNKLYIIPVNDSDYRVFKYSIDEKITL